MKQHELECALELASRRREGGGSSELWGRVLDGIQRGWDPEAVEWRRLLGPWRAAAILTALLVGGAMVLLPHGRHRVPRPPEMTVFKVTGLHALPSERSAK